jgi:hypothetical protein
MTDILADRVDSESLGGRMPVAGRKPNPDGMKQNRMPSTMAGPRSSTSLRSCVASLGTHRKARHTPNRRGRVIE